MDDPINARADRPLAGTMVPYHWYDHLEMLAARNRMDVKVYVRRMLDRKETPLRRKDNAALLGWSARSYIQNILPQVFPSLPAWNMPMPRVRRTKSDKE